jgi:tripeptide aminopeptidase
VKPDIKPIRGGTDGARLSFMGLPCPNIFTGGYNFHGIHEFITIEGMEQAVRVIVKLAEKTSEKYQ